MNLFLGDSFTKGDTSWKGSFADIIGDSINLGINGTTIGEYSIYPVDGKSLLSVISRNIDIIKLANNIYLEYGINDVSSIMCGFATEQTVLVSLVKAVDWIKQINPNASIYFLSLSNNSDIIYMFAKSQCKYLTEDYFKGYSFNFPELIWSNTYLNIMNSISKNLKMIYMFDKIDWKNEIAIDGLHPNEKGYENIANKLL